jgi:hypothetical protein
MVDQAEAKLREALDGDHLERSLRARLFILSHSHATRERGWRRHGDDGRYDAPPAVPAPTVVIWAGDSPGYHPPLPYAGGTRAAGFGFGVASVIR